MTINTTKTTAQLKGLQLDLFCTVCCFLPQVDALGSKSVAHAPTGFYHVYCFIMTQQARVNFLTAVALPYILSKCKIIRWKTVCTVKQWEN